MSKPIWLWLFRVPLDLPLFIARRALLLDSKRVCTRGDLVKQICGRTDKIMPNDSQIVDHKTPHNNSATQLTMRLVCALVVASLLSQSPSALAQTVTCPDGSIGYGTTASLNADIRAEAERVANGEQAADMYVYNFCTNLDITANEPLAPLLDGSVFVCGNGDPANNCRLTGGSDQVNIGPSTIPNYVIEDVRFEGVTFTGFTNSAITGDATSVTSLTLTNVVFEVSRRRRRHGSQHRVKGSILTTLC